MCKTSSPGELILSQDIFLTLFTCPWENTSKWIIHSVGHCQMWARMLMLFVKALDDDDVLMIYSNISYKVWYFFPYINVDSKLCSIFFGLFSDLVTPRFIIMLICIYCHFYAILCYFVWLFFFTCNIDPKVDCFFFQYIYPNVVQNILFPYFSSNVDP